MNDHENITYRQLLSWLKSLSDEDLNKNVSVYVNGIDEWVPVSATDFTKEDDVLDKDHPYLITD